MKAYFYENHRLFDIGLSHEFAPKRRVMQSFEGVDQDYVLFVPASPNWSSTLVVETFFSPGPSFTQEEFRANLDKEDATLILLSNLLGNVFYTKGYESTVVSSGPPVVTAAPHGLSVADQIYVLKGDGSYFYTSVVSVPAPDQFTVAGVVIGNGDKVYLIRSIYPECMYEGMTKPRASGKDGDYYGLTQYSFQLSGEGVYNRD